jgi:hypothetical protein
MRSLGLTITNPAERTAVAARLERLTRVEGEHRIAPKTVFITGTYRAFPSPGGRSRIRRECRRGAS